VAKVDKPREHAEHPRDWSIDDLKAIAKRHGLDWRQPGTSHVTFSAAGRMPLTVPSHRAIKPIYVIRFVSLIDSLGGGNGD
jgi:2-hydroxychromene-2-carboxylate isomerase